MKHSGVKGPSWTAQRPCRPELSERRAGLETGNAEADPPAVRGRPMAGREEKRQVHRSVFAGVVASACMEEGRRGNTGSPVGGVHASTGTPRGTGRPGRVAEGLVRLKTPGNAGRGKEPQVWRDAVRTKVGGSGHAYDPAIRTGSSEASHAEVKGLTGDGAMRCRPGQRCGGVTGPAAGWTRDGTESADGAIRAAISASSLATASRGRTA